MSVSLTSFIKMANFSTFLFLIFGCLATIAATIDIRVLENADIRFGPDDVVYDKSLVIIFIIIVLLKNNIYMSILLF